MRLIKMFGLAAIAAVMAMAFLGASSAMATNTALCKVDVITNINEECPLANRIHHVHAVSVSATGVQGLSAKLLTPVVTVECEALFLGDVTSPNDLGNPLTIAGNFTYPTCNAGCKATQISAGATVSVLKTAQELATVTGQAEILVQCGEILHCVYNGTGLTGHGLGGLSTGATFGEKGHITFTNAAVNKVKGLLCPASASLDALFQILGEKGYLGS